ncbi:MAG TPA: HPF/RaiA family ribosome-associated protein [Chitinophagaceae bacterium]|nr:HPF/RaiA family ribosome-associated protein [Chitinophagaceae bacterium]
MNIIIKSVDFKAGKALETFVKNKVSKLFRQCGSIIRANVILRKGESKSTANKLCEIRLIVPGYDHFVKKSTGEYYKSVSQSVNVLQEILRRNKTKVLTRR